MKLGVPLLSYVAVTIVVPILNGAPLDWAFAEHVALAAGLPFAIAIALGRFFRLLGRANLTSAPCAGGRETGQERSASSSSCLRPCQESLPAKPWWR